MTEHNQQGGTQVLSEDAKQIATLLGISPENWTEFVQTLRTDDTIKSYFANGPRPLQMAYNGILESVPENVKAGSN